MSFKEQTERMLEEIVGTPIFEIKAKELNHSATLYSKMKAEGNIFIPNSQLSNVDPEWSTGEESDLHRRVCSIKAKLMEAFPNCSIGIFRNYLNKQGVHFEELKEYTIDKETKKALFLGSIFKVL